VGNVFVFRRRLKRLEGRDAWRLDLSNLPASQPYYFT